MTEFSSHQPGAFSWVELATTDRNAAVTFYRTLFGWDLDDRPMGHGETYSMFMLRGQEVAAARTMYPPEREAGAPPHWNLYVTVASAERAAALAQSLGASVLVPAFDVMDAGRMATIQDPTGAVVHLWEAKRSIGARIMNEPGALCWSELTTRDPKAAEAFYQKLFGWTTTHGTASAVMEYTEFSNQGVPGGGMMAFPPGLPASVPSYWMPYFQVTDCDAVTARAATLGAKVMVPPNDIPNTGRFSILTDPQGAIFAAIVLKNG